MKGRKALTKLIAAFLLLMLSLTLAAAGTYAWFTLSTAPEIGGMQLSIGGSNTIRIAPDVSESVAGGLVHYPGTFGEELTLSGSLGSLTPVSTADGIHWFLPTYQKLSDGGALEDISKFTMETDLSHGYTPGASESGSYVYLDFWIVAPTAQTVRIATGTSAQDTAGSFAMARPKILSDGNGNYTVSPEPSAAAASLRVGFLADGRTTSDAAVFSYVQSAAYNKDYHTLKGVYQNRGEQADEETAARFTIYEPNGDLHPQGQTGVYNITKPIGLLGMQPTEIDVTDRLTVQLASGWTISGEDTKISQALAAALLQAQTKNMALESEQAVSDYLFDTYLQGQLEGYVTTGGFVKRAADLKEGGTAETGGATEDVWMVSLEANVPQRIRMFLWLEGQDVDCGNDAMDASLILNLELAGASGASS